METREQLKQIDHLLAGLETEDFDFIKEIWELRREVHDFLELCLIGQTVIARAGIEMIAPKIDDLVSRLGRDTLPGIQLK